MIGGVIRMSTLWRLWSIIRFIILLTFALSCLFASMLPSMVIEPLVKKVSIKLRKEITNERTS